MKSFVLSALNLNDSDDWVFLIGAWLKYFLNLKEYFLRFECQTQVLLIFWSIAEDSERSHLCF